MVKQPLAYLLAIVLFTSFLAACSSGPEITSLTEQEALGQRLFGQNCAACHAQSGEGVIVGPSLAGIAERAESRVTGEDAHDYIVESIVDPEAYLNEGFDNLMPATFGDTLNEEQIEALVAYLYLLK